MGAEEHTVEVGNPEKRLDEARAAREEQEGTEKPEVTDEHKERAKEMAKVYKEDRPTTVLPGTGGAVSGTTVTDWVDEKGEPKYDSEAKPES
jgi:hypothetical protein